MNCVWNWSSYYFSGWYYCEWRGRDRVLAAGAAKLRINRSQGQSSYHCIIMIEMGKLGYGLVKSAPDPRPWSPKTQNATAVRRTAGGRGSSMPVALACTHVTGSVATEDSLFRKKGRTSRTWTAHSSKNQRTVAQVNLINSKEFNQLSNFHFRSWTW